MKLRIVILGLSITSSWGNGHATVYRGLVSELAQRGHHVLFLERDKPWYASHRDLAADSTDPISRCNHQTCLYQSVAELQQNFAEAIRSADCVIVGSYVPEGVRIGEWVTETATGVTAFYDIDTPVTLSKLADGDHEYLCPELIPRYSLFLSFSGGGIPAAIEKQYGSPMARAFYCCVSPSAYYPENVAKRLDLGYLGTFSEDRQPALERLLMVPAKEWEAGRFAVAGPLYPPATLWPTNVERIDHLPPPRHRAFYNAQRFTLSVSRGEMMKAGYSPSVRLFEAAACGIPVLSDPWPGLGEFFEPGTEMLVANSTAEVLDYLQRLGEREARAIGDRARRRILAEHTATHRAIQLENLISAAAKMKRNR